MALTLADEEAVADGTAPDVDGNPIADCAPATSGLRILFSA